MAVALAVGCLANALWLGESENHVETIEINTYGEPHATRSVAIFRDSADRVVDWRWLDDIGERAIQQVGPRRWLALWRQGPRIFHVVARRLTYSRTLHDVELSERNRWPEHKRTKLR